MKKIVSPLAVIILALSISSCGYQGSYRYPCQDPANWESKECNPPLCTAYGQCTKDLIGSKAWQDYQNEKTKNG